MTHYSLKSSPGQKLENVTKTLKGNDTGVEITGANNAVTKTKFTGGGYGMKIQSGASGLKVNGFTTVNPVEYGIYIGKGVGTKPNDNLELNDVTADLVTAGLHCIRIYAATNLKGKKWRMKHLAPYDGATVNIKQVSGMTVSDLILTGQPLGIGPNEKNLGEDSYWAEDITLDGGKWDFTTQIVFWPNVRKVTIKNTTINVAKNEVFTVRPSLRTRKEPVEISILNCPITCSGKLFTGNGAVLNFKGSGYNGKPI